MDGIPRRLGRSRTYHATIALIAISYCILLPRSAADWISEQIFAQCFAAGLLVTDSGIRFLSFGNASLLTSVDYALSAICVNILVFEILFQSFAVISLTSVLSFACATRAVVAIHHCIVYKDSFKPQLRRLVVNSVIHDSPPPGGARRKSVTRMDLDLCYVTSRIIAVSKNALSSQESSFLDQKHSSLLKSLAVPYTNEILPLAALNSIVDSAVRHLFSNSASVVSVNTPAGDSTPVLVLVCLLIRTGAVSPPTASRALSYLLKQRYVITPATETVLSASQYSQLKIFEKIMTTRSAPPDWLGTLDLNQKWTLRRVTLSQFDASKFSDLLLTVVDVSTGTVFGRDLAASVSSGSVSFSVACKIGSDTFLVFTDSGTGKRQFAHYFNSNFHLVRSIAMKTTFNHVSTTDDSEHYSTRMKGVGARLEVLAQSDDRGDVRAAKSCLTTDIDRDLLALPIGGAGINSLV